MIDRRALIGGGLLASASAAGAQSFRLGRSPQFRSGLRFPAVSALAATTWNPADKGSSDTLSNGNLTVTNTSGNGTVRSIAGKSTGKYHAEFRTVTGNSNCAIGVASSAASLSQYIGVDSESCGYYQNGNVYQGNAIVATYAAWTDADRPYFELDAANKRIWFGLNGTINGNPAAGTGFISLTAGLPIYAAATPYTTGGTPVSVTANFGATAFAYTPSTGFGPFTT